MVIKNQKLKTTIENLIILRKQKKMSWLPLNAFYTIHVETLIIQIIFLKFCIVFMLFWNSFGLDGIAGNCKSVSVAIHVDFKTSNLIVICSDTTRDILFFAH